SLLLSPLVAGLALILGGRNRQVAELEAERRRVRTITSSSDAAAATTGGAATSAGFWGIGRLWGGSIIVFAVLYWLVFGFNFTSAGSALYLSIQIGPFR